nr:SDR family NAD(P)-dependent oxidoreductase [Actinomadura rugatobispora]
MVGASSGIGAAVAQTLLRSGWRVTVAARRLDALAELAERLGPACVPAAVDVTDAESVDRLARSIRNGPELNALVNCAGHDLGGRTPFHRSEIDDALSVLHTNAAGLLRLTHAMLPALAEADPADVVNVGSVNGVRAAAGLAAYSASKFAVHGFTAALREECSEIGVRVTEVLPGMTRTDFAATRWRGDQAKAAAYYDSYPALLDPADVANAVRFALEQPPGVCLSEITILPFPTRDSRP